MSHETPSSAPDGSLPSAPEPAGEPAAGGNPERYSVPYAADWHQVPFSRIGIGVGLSPLGININSAIVLNQYFDARVMVDFLGISVNRFEIDGVNAQGNLHLASSTVAVDAYPFNSVWRLSAGLMYLNGNQISAQVRVAGGETFKLGSTTYYSYNGDEVTGSAFVGLNSVKPAPMASFGFGKYIPRSNRHWSFPTEFGVVYTGAPSLNVGLAGTVCTDRAQTKCSSVDGQDNPVGIAFNQNLQSRLTLWRKDLARVPISPILSYSVVYSFNIR